MNPYRLPNPSVVSFSGGRTSAYMLHEVIKAFGGKLPAYVRVVFCNTGKEREETLEFVERCSQRWDVPIAWLEYCRSGNASHGTKVVDFQSASRHGEPLDAVISYFRDHRAGNGHDPVLPNPVSRFCTAEGKLRASHRHVTQTLRWKEYHDAIGLRFDEPKRVLKMLRQTHVVNESTLFGLIGTIVRGNSLPAGEIPVCPLSEAKVTLQDVHDFWQVHPFDLQLRSDEGNCDHCFLKSSAKILRLIRERPDSVDWWIAKEEESGQTFRQDRPSYAEMKRIALGVVDGPGWLFTDKTNDGSCGEVEECRCTD